jgi:hypothetical protein
MNKEDALIATNASQHLGLGHLRARVMHDANFVCGDSRRRIVPPGQNVDPPDNQNRLDRL